MKAQMNEEGGGLMAKKLWSIFTDDMDKCFMTGRYDGIERHH